MVVRQPEAASLMLYDCMYEGCTLTSYYLSRYVTAFAGHWKKHRSSLLIHTQGHTKCLPLLLLLSLLHMT